MFVAVDGEGGELRMMRVEDGGFLFLHFLMRNL